MAKRRNNMNVKFNSLFDIYPDKFRKGAVVGYRKADGSMLEFPCTLDTGDSVRDAKGRWTASALGLKPVIAKYSGALKRTKAVEAWIGEGFSMNPVATYLVENATLEHVCFVDDVTSIGYFAFSDCIGLTSVTIPEGVASIGGYAFEGCTGLASVTIPESVTEIEGHAFSGCSELTSINIPDSVMEIGHQTFEDCTRLTSITIPASVTYIGCHAFGGCSGLTDIYIDQPESDLLDNTKLPEGCTVHWKQAETI